MAVTILTTPLLQAFGTNQSLTVSHNRDIQRATLWLGGHQQEPEGQYEKSVIHVRVPPGQVP
jgi:hypothetical protein